MTVHVSKCQSLSLSVVRRSVTGVLTGQNKTNTQTSGLKSETALANTSKSLFIIVSSLVGEQCSLFLRTYYFLRLTNRKQPWLSIQIKFRQSIQMKRVYNILALTGAVSDFRQIKKKKRKHSKNPCYLILLESIKKVFIFLFYFVFFIFF